MAKKVKYPDPKFFRCKDQIDWKKQAENMKEIGGIIGEIYSDTEFDRICVQGRTWRGMLSDKVIIPPAGADYATASGTVNAVLKSLVEPEFGGLFVVPVTDGPTVNWQFDTTYS